MTGDFVKALELGDAESVAATPKSDYHIHWLYGSKLVTFEKKFGRPIPPAPVLHSIDDMLRWVRENIWPVFDNDLKEFHLFAIRSSLAQAVEDTVLSLEMSIDIDFMMRCYGTDFTAVIDSIESARKEVAPEIDFRPELGIKGDPSGIRTFFDAIIKTGYFKSIDLYGVEENALDYSTYRYFFDQGREHGLKLKAHVGEFGDAQLVRNAAEILGLDEIQHGIGAASSPEVMDWLAEKGIRLNVCPTSNVRLARVKDIMVHPIRTLYDHGVDVTINTDDMTIFGNNVSDEYLALYRSGLFTAVELDDIRRAGLGDYRTI